MQNRFILLISYGTQNFSLCGGRFLQYFKRLIAMSRQDYIVELRRFPIWAGNLYSILTPDNPFNGAMKTNPVQKFFHKASHILAGTSSDHSPLGTVIDIQHAVILIKSCDKIKRRIEHLQRAPRPNGWGHGDSVIIPKLRRVVPFFKKFPKSHLKISTF